MIISKTRVWNIIAAIFIATFLKFCFNALTDNGINFDYPSQSVLRSREKGIFISTVKVDPKSFPFQNSNVVLGEAWLEKQVKTTHPFIWFSSWTWEGDYFLCFVLDDGKDLFSLRPGNQPFFNLKVESPGSFVEFNGGQLFYHQINSDEFANQNAEGRLGQASPNSTGPLLKFTW